jgi:hypothetical protein
MIIKVFMGLEYANASISSSGGDIGEIGTEVLR